MNQLKNDKVRQAFATRFRQALAALGYSVSDQKAVRELFGVSPQAVRKWAEGLSMPNSARMPAVAAVLGVRRAWLQDGEEPVKVSRAHVAETKPAYSSEDVLDISADELALLQHYRRLSPQQRDLIQNLLAQFVK
jgi:transcriptional regulator with XRE-family HTH domain